MIVTCWSSWLLSKVDYLYIKITFFNSFRLKKVLMFDTWRHLESSLCWLTLVVRNQQTKYPVKIANHCLSLQYLSDDWQTALPHIHISVMTAHYSVGCHKATRWFGMRVTCDWHCSGGLVRVTPKERRVGGCNQETQTCTQCNCTIHVFNGTLRCQSAAYVGFIFNTCNKQKYISTIE